MSTVAEDEVAEILERVGRLPVEYRLDLARKILGTLEREFKIEPKPKKSLSDLVGILEIEGPPPTLDDYQRILEDELIKKYCG